MNSPEEKLTYSVKETAKLLGISKNSCYQALLKGEIPHIKIGKRILIPQKALWQMIDDTRGKKSEQDVEKFLDYIKREPQRFIDDIREIGRNEDTEALLKLLLPFITEADLTKIFPQGLTRGKK